jgi:hypothetical protein
MKCPLIKKKCMEHDCTWYIHLRGTNPNTGQEIDQWGCSMTWMPMLLVENSQQQRQTGSAVESFRNEMVKNNENILQGIINGSRQNLPNIS